jgi:hypothetical protein
MGFIKWLYLTPVTWTAWQFGVLKWCNIALGIVLGTLFAEFWRPHLWLVGLVFVVTGVWTGVMYFRAMERPSSSTATESELQTLP